MKIYCSGIGGIGLSAYASMMRAAGHTVLGSDRSESELLADLRSQGIGVMLNQDGSEVPKDAELFVYSEAIPEAAPERKAAKSYGIPQKSYPEAVAELTKGHRLIAVCGTHGKSSTTAMAARMMLDSGMDPSIVVGTKMNELNNRNWHKGQGNDFVLEACEYRRSFLNYKPQIILLTTCDGDHFDYFESQEDYRKAFLEFIRSLPPDGVLITHMSDPDCAAVARESGKSVIDADTNPLPKISVPGMHMQQNAQLALALAEHLGLDLTTAKKSLEGFRGTWRRMEQCGQTKEGAIVYDDYGHHPREIRATIEGLRTKFPDRKLFCVFQPHTHDRTLKLWDDFAKSFGGANLVIIPNVYDARAHLEKKTVDLPAFLKAIEDQSGVPAVNGQNFEETERTVHALAQEGDIVLCMGAGDITNLATNLLS